MDHDVLFVGTRKRESQDKKPIDLRFSLLQPIRILLLTLVTHTFGALASLSAGSKVSDKRLQSHEWAFH